MACRTIKVDGVAAILCTRGRGRRKCSVCGKPADILCDWPTSTGACDKPLCRRHAIQGPGPNTDYCQSHGAEREGAEP